MTLLTEFSLSLFVTYLQEFINFNLSVLVEVHLIKDFMECVFINVDIDALQRRKTTPGINDIQWRQMRKKETNKEKAMTKTEDSPPKLAARRQWWWILCSLCQTYGSAFCTCQTDEQEFNLTLLYVWVQYLAKVNI